MEEWQNAKDFLPPELSVIVKVKRENGKETKAYYHREDTNTLFGYHKGKLAHFQDYKSLEFLHDVTHWKYL